MIEHNALRTRSGEGFRKNLGKAASRAERIHMGSENMNVFRGPFHIGDRDDRSRKDDIDAVFFGRLVGRERKIDDVLPVEIRLGTDLKERRSDSILRIHILPSSYRSTLLPCGLSLFPYYNSLKKGVNENKALFCESFTKQNGFSG